MAHFKVNKPEVWESLALKERRKDSPEEMLHTTLEGIPLKPLYTAADLAEIEYHETMPGMAPFLRGPRATIVRFRDSSYPQG